MNTNQQSGDERAAEGREDGGGDLRIGIAELDDDAAKVILMASINWGCTPEEAAARMLNDATRAAMGGEGQP